MIDRMSRQIFHYLELFLRFHRLQRKNSRNGKVNMP